MYSLQKLYERADLYCTIGFPYEGADPESNAEFTNTIKMLIDFCSAEGYVITQWIVEKVGFKKETGMSV